MCSVKAFPLCLLAVASFFSTALFCTPASIAQSSAIAPRITANIDETRLTTLKGNVSRLARAEYDQGEADASTQLTHIRLVLSRSSEQQAALEAYLAELQDKSSPNFHKWLTPDQFGKLYGPADSDVEALVAWLESHGLKLEAVSAGRTNISFSGNVSQVEEAFHTSIHSFQASGRQFYSNTTNPRIPAALTTVVKGVARLNTIQPRPQYVPGKIGKFDPETGRLRALSVSSSQAGPQLTTDDNGTQSLYVTPADAATIYNTPNSFNLNNSSATSYTGSGVTIGIAGDSAIATNYVTAYRSLFLGDTKAPTITNIDNVGTVSGDDAEAYLDLEVSGGLAPGATIHFYTATLLDTAIERALNDNAIDILSLSFGECEQDMDTSDNLLIEGWWQQAAGQGIAVTVSSGDSGSAGCDYPSDTNGNNVTDATGGLRVSGLASTPYNIAVGGTDYYALLNSFSTYVTEASSSSSTAGSASTYYRTAKSYIPESTWNDSTYYLDNTTISANVPWTAISGYSSYANIAAGSGGASNCSTNATTYSGSNTNMGSCTSGYSKPSWQTGVGVPADGERDIPDVSLLAADGMDGASWIICYPETYQGKTYQGCIKQSDGSWYILGMGGTSAAAPAFAGILALVEQKTGDRLGQAAQTLYGLYNGSHSSSIFHDVTVGNISVPCTSGTTNCVENSAGYYFESGYNTTTGYDLATGLGSVDATALVNYWTSAAGTKAATVTVTPASSSIASTDSLSVVVTVASSATGGTTPTGTVTLSGGGMTAQTGTLSSGSYTFTIPAGSLKIGSDTLTVTYSGDTTYAPTTNTSATVQVNGLVPTITVTPSATSINSNTALTVNVAVSGTGATPSGTVTLAGGGYASTATLASGGYTFTIPYNTFTATGTVTLTATYGGDSIYDSGYTGSANVTVNYIPVSTPTVTVTPSSYTPYSNQSLSVLVTVTGSSSEETYPSGTVTLVATASGSSTAIYTAVAETLVNGSYTFTIPAYTFSSTETVTLTVTYSGDAAYYSKTGTYTVTVTKSVFAVTPATAAAISAPGGSTTSAITVGTGANYVGTVTLTCALTSSPTGANYLPSCSISPTTVALSSSTTSGTATATIKTTAATTSSLVSPKLPGKNRGVFGAAGGALLAFVVFLGIPARRRGWRSMLGVLVLMTLLGSLSACGGGSSSSNTSSTTGTAGTTTGTYVFTVTGTGNDANTTTETATFSVTVD